MFQLDNKPLGLDTAFTHNEISYPANWLRLASAEEKAAIGIIEVDDAPTYDDRYYWGPNNPKQLEDEIIIPEDGQDFESYVQKGLKSQVIAQVKDTAGKLMQPTDWMVLRQLFKNIGMSAHVENYRDAVVASSNQFEAQIDACTTVEELAALQFAWPDAKDF